MASPVLLGENGVGKRKTEAGIAKALREAKAGMPDLLGRLPVDARKQAFDDLVAYLVAQGGPRTEERTELLEDEFERGRDLYRTVGCAVYHGADASALALAPADREEAFTFSSLAAYLENPHAAWPGGPMPSMNLPPIEARAVAAFLLGATDDSPRLAVSREPGLHVEYHEQPMGPDGLPADDRDATRTFVHSGVDITFPHRPDEFGVRFRGEIHAPVSGEYTFWIGSDDGSWLRIAGKETVALGGLHGFGFKPGKIKLDEGWHAFEVDYFEAQGDEALALEWKGPGFGRGVVPPEAFRHEARVLVTGGGSEVLDAARAARGAELYTSLGCVQCHDGGTPSAFAGAAPLLGLDATRGCLADPVPDAAPRFVLNSAEGTTLREVVSRARDLQAPLGAAAKVSHAMERLDCYACHSRDGRGGPTDLTNPLFTGDEHAELGDQGRIPPRLDGAGDKFRPDALVRILETGEKVRPYMNTRMPVFDPAALGPLASNFRAADHVPGHELEPAFSEESADTGRLLVGTTGVACIQCHTVSGKKSLGVPAVDLPSMHRRLQPGWFLAFLNQPSAFTPLTRMMQFWLPGERIFPQYAGGDARKQQEAIWNYLSLGGSMPLPAGIQLAEGEYDLVPGSEPIVFGTFLRDASARTFCVGYPELVHAAYDAENMRLAKAWRGDFIEASGTWHARAGALQDPAPKDVITFPPGPAFAILASRDSAWPDPPANAWKFRGTSRDAERRPSFAIARDDVRIAESPQPAVRRGGAGLRRTIAATAAADRGDVWMRVATGAKIEPATDAADTFVVENATRIRIEGAKGFVRDGSGDRELLVPVDFKYVEGADAPYRAAFAVEVSW